MTCGVGFRLAGSRDGVYTPIMNTLLLSMALTFGAETDPPKPVVPPSAVAIAPTRIDCGTVRAGTPLSRTFRIANNSPAAISVVEVTPGCGCLRVALAGRVLLPGETADLTVEINTLSQPVGANTWRLRVRTAEVSGGEPRVVDRELSLEAKVVREVRVDPVSIGLSTAGEIDQIVTVVDARAKPLSVTSASTGLKHFRCEVLPRTANDSPGETRVRLLVPLDCPAGAHSDALSIRTNDPDYPEIRVPVRVTRRSRGGIEAVPETAMLRFASGQSHAVAVVRLRDLGEKPVKIASVTCDSPGVVCKAVAGPGEMMTLKITGEAAKLAADARGTIEVTFEDDAKTVRKIPVEWLLP